MFASFNLTIELLIFSSTKETSIPMTRQQSFNLTIELLIFSSPRLGRVVGATEEFQSHNWASYLFKQCRKVSKQHRQMNLVSISQLSFLSFQGTDKRTHWIYNSWSFNLTIELLIFSSGRFWWYKDRIAMPVSISQLSFLSFQARAWLRSRPQLLRFNLTIELLIFSSQACPKLQGLLRNVSISQLSFLSFQANLA